MAKNELGIWCAGRFLQAVNWTEHEWGIPSEGLLGQIPTTVLLAREYLPKTIAFGTGASQKGGVLEADYIYQYLMDNFEKLTEFPQFQDMNLFGLSRLANFIYRSAVRETKSQNTAQEIEYVAKIFDANGIGRMMAVANPDHISRCYQLAHQIGQKVPLECLQTGHIFAAQSAVGYNGTANITSKIVEMPHRGDDKSPNLASTIGSYFGLPVEAKEEYFKFSQEFFSKYKK